MSEKEQMDLKKVREFIELMKENDLVELEIVSGHNKVMLKRPQPAQPTITQLPPASPTPAAPVLHAQSAPQQQQTTEEQTKDPGIVEIASPIVGTFYAAPSPDAEPYVEEGAKVAPDSVVCIIEAMKVMNEIKAETSGTIVEVLCQAGQAVEYGQILFRVRTN